MLRNLLLTILIAVPVFAQDDINLGNIIGAGKYQGAKTSDGQTVVPVLGVNSNGNTEVNSLSGYGVDLSVQKTPIAKVVSGGVSFPVNGTQPIFPAASVITPSTSVPTPSAGNTLTNRNTILAAGAPTAAYVVLPVITASVGKTYRVYNQGSNPLAIVPQTGVINVSAALTPFSCTTLKECQCQGLTTGVWGCSQQ